ncbi:MAG: IPT/TIG domain-containing protein, partial [Planctomycetes bacterium]|nr:IPT/TIG domain-containing protein [Planctomycetota bacterium]
MGNGESYCPSISSDGRYVAFYSYATNLGVDPGGYQVYRKDLQTGQIACCSVSSGGQVGNGESYCPSISSDGRYVAFYSYATNLGVDPGGCYQVYRKDLQTGQITCCSVSSGGEVGNNRSDDPSISSDGRYVAFYSGATNLGVDPGGYCQVYRKEASEGGDLLIDSSDEFEGSADSAGSGRYRLHIHNNRSLWFALKRNAGSGASVQPSSPFSYVDLVPPKGNSTYVGTYSGPSQTVGFTGAWDARRSWLMNFFNPIFELLNIDAVQDIEPGNIDSFIEAFLNIPRGSDIINAYKQGVTCLMENRYPQALNHFRRAGWKLLRMSVESAGNLADVISGASAKNVTASKISSALGYIGVVLYCVPVFYDVFVDFFSSTLYGLIPYINFTTTNNYSGALKAPDSRGLEAAKTTAGTLGSASAPSAPALSPPSGTTIGNSRVLTASVPEQENVKHVDFEYSTNGTDWTAIGSSSSQWPGAFNYYVTFDTSAIGTASVQVRARSFDFSETPGSYATATYNLDHQAPAAPTGLIATGTPGSVSLSWDANTEPDVESYDVYRATSPGGEYAVIGSTMVGVSTDPTSYRDTTAGTGGPYYYRVSALDACFNEGPQTTEVTATTTSGGATPTDLELLPADQSAVSDTVTLVGSAKDTGVITDISFSYSTGGSFTPIGSASQISYDQDNGSFSGSLSWDASGVPDGNMEIKMTATDSEGPSSSITHSVAKNTVPPPVPSGLSSSYSSNNVNLRWDNASGASSYVVMYHDDSTNLYQTLGFSDANSLTHSNPPKGKTYSYKVASLNQYNTRSEFSPEVSITVHKSPSLTSISPNSGTRGTTVSVTSLSGTDFYGTPTVKLKKAGQTDITATNVTATSTTKITCKLPIPANAATGQWNLYVQNPDGQNVTKNNAFTVNAPPPPPPSKPEITSVSPASGPPGTTVTIKGSNFGSSRGTASGDTGGAASYVAFNGVPATEYKTWSDTKIEAIVPQGASPGPVTVVTSAGTSNTDKIFTVAYPTWYLAEGTTDWGFDTYISIENPGSEQVSAKVTYMPTGKDNKEETITLPANSQTTLTNDHLVSVMGQKGDFSTKVECKEGKTIAVDRTMSWTGPGAPSPEGHCSVGVTSPAKTWYLPEGSSDWGFECWLLIQNPNDTEATATVTYMIEGKGPQTFEKKVPASSRASFNMADDIGAKDASIKVVSDISVIPERAMYRNNRREGHDS